MFQIVYSTPLLSRNYSIFSLGHGILHITHLLVVHLQEHSSKSEPKGIIESNKRLCLSMLKVQLNWTFQHKYLHIPTKKQARVLQRTMDLN